MHEKVFSRRALALAPLPMTFVLSVFFEMTTPGHHPVIAIAVFFLLGSLLAWCVTAVLLLPSLFVLSRLTRITILRSGLLGLVLGFVFYFPYAWEMFQSTGVDSGPPTGTFREYLMRQGFEWDFWALLIAGLVTASLYWVILQSERTKEEPRTEDPAKV